MASRIRLSCTDFTFGLLPHDDALALIRAIGMDGVDIGVFGADAHTSPRQVLKDIPRAARQLRTKLKRAGLALADVFAIPGDEWTLTPNHPETRVRRQSRQLFERMLDYIARCGGKHMSMLPGMPWKDESPATSMKRCAEELAWRVSEAKQAGIDFSVEAHTGSIAPTPKKALKLLDMTPGLTLTLDHSHFAARGFSDRAIEPLLPHTSHVHARGASRNHRQTPVKHSTIDYRRVVRLLQRNDYSGYISFEYEFFDVDPGDELDTLGETILLRDAIRKALGVKAAARR